jgi:hypothetical protein
MESPPPYSPPPRPKSKNTPWIVLGVIGVLICCGGPILLLGGGYWLFSKNKDMFECTINLAVTQKAMEAYVRKNGSYPPAATWQTALKPFASEDKSDADARKAMGLAALNLDGPIACATGELKTGLSYNSALSGKKTADIKDSEIMIFESTELKPNANGVFKERGSEDSPKIMGNPRGWFYVTVAGKVRGVKGQGNIEIDTKD